MRKAWRSRFESQLKDNLNKTQAIDFSGTFFLGSTLFGQQPTREYMKTVAVVVGAALMGALPAAIAAPKDQSKQDQAFVDEAARGGKMEVDLGRLAEQNASDANVKQFGARMVKDHTKLNSELGSVLRTSLE
jgi:hypothetical protein